MKHKISGWDFGVPNRNHRVYTREIVEAAIDRCSKPILVTMDTLESTFEKVDLSKVCGRVVGFEFTQDGVVAEIEITDTPCDKIVSQLFAAGSRLDLVPCGIGGCLRYHGT